MLTSLHRIVTFQYVFGSAGDGDVGLARLATREVARCEMSTSGEKSMKVAIGCDEAGYALKEILKPFIVALGHEVTDFGTFDGKPVLYPDIGHAVAAAVAAGKHESAVLICGTGIGMAITANKVKGIRAAQCHDTYSAERARKSNDAQIVTFGARVIGPELAKSIVNSFLASHFNGGPSAEKVERIKAYENGATERPIQV
jgi:ribose 5-phosphate isomerase B